MKDEKSFGNTGLLQPAKVNYKTLEECSYDDPCIFSNIANEQEMSPYETKSETEQWTSKAITNRLAVIIILLLMVIQTIFGFLSSSLACITDVFRLSSDYLGQHRISEKNSASLRRLAYQPRRYVALGDFIDIKIRQLIHLIGNHGVSLIFVLEAIIINIQVNF
ncbi:unnamed protein product [Dracunculus medinensis]|uniref:ABC transmembrane type-1 domain-containing protein n=1 Tax=Dracunculus medinensis TaxID=318479 RepID=A0A0N4U9R1_DRAME|nr:unnamed protein product [Dracunculus medinensis]